MFLFAAFSTEKDFSTATLIYSLQLLEDLSFYNFLNETTLRCRGKYFFLLNIFFIYLIVSFCKLKQKTIFSQKAAFQHDAFVGSMWKMQLAMPN